MIGKASWLPREPPMAIYRLLKNHAFGPDEIKVLTAAYEAALRTGERDPVRLRERAIRSLSE
jgi:hypothetical protein